MSNKAIPSKAYAAPSFNDAVDLPRSGTLFIGNGGTLVCTLADMDDGDSVTYNNITDGTDFPRAVKRIWATGTTVSNVVIDG